MASSQFRVLLVDDDEDEWILLRALLAKSAAHRFMVTWTSRYDEALLRIARREFDAYLIDYQLGERSGFELLEAAIAAGCQEPLIVLTANRSAELASAALQAGAVDFIDKQELSAPLLERSIRYAIERAKGARLSAALREHKQSALVRERLLGIVGHDLRNPLASIQAAGHVLLRLPELQSERGKQLAAAIVSSGNRMTQMISDLLDFTRARLGDGIPIDPRSIDATEVSRRVLEETRVAHPHRLMQLTAPERLPVYWDPERIAQALSNLLINAVQHGDPARPVVLSLTENGAQVALSVHNHGPAIPEDLRISLFDPFKRGAHEAVGRSEGLGLGLYIVDRIVAGHSGSISVESSAQSGTRITLTLPKDSRRPGPREGRGP